MVYRRMNVRLT